MHDLFFSSGTGHSLMILSFVIGIGLLLGKVKIKGISLGSIWVLFVGILFGALGIRDDSLFLHFLKEFGLVLFVFTIGFQVGPGFFSSFRKGGLRFNLLSLLLVGLVVLTTLCIWWATGESIPQMVGTMSGAVTNTPGMGTSQQTWYDTVYGTFLAEVEHPYTASEIANSFAIAYPVGLVAALLVMVLLRWLFRVDINKESQALLAQKDGRDTVHAMQFQVLNPALYGKPLLEILDTMPGDYTVSGLYRADKAFTRNDNPVLEEGDRISVDAAEKERTKLRLCFGGELKVQEGEEPAGKGSVVTRKIMITKSSFTGTKIRELDLENKYGVSVVRILRSGVELVARPDLFLQMGDGLRVVGSPDGLDQVSALFGNNSSELDKPNLAPVFIGIGLGLILGAVPIHFPGMNHVVRFGLAAGPLLLGIIIGHFGPKWKITTYTSTSALRMIRELGLCLLLATVGLGAGGSFAETFATSGAEILLYSAIIAFVPLMLTAVIARYLLHQNFFHICGLLSGATTNPFALDFVTQVYKTEEASVAYASVYPFALFLQVVSAQLLILLGV